MAESFCSPGRRDLWSEVKRVKGAGNVTAPTCVDDAVGEEEVAGLFSDKYSDLYNSVQYNVDDLSALTEELLLSVRTHCNVDNPPALCHSVCAADVKNAVRKLKLNKGDDERLLFTNNVIHGSPLLNVYLALLFDCMLCHIFVPPAFTLSTLVPIPKNIKKSVQSSSNYRAIALSNILGKIIDHIILLKCSHVFTSSDLQFGFKAHHSTSMCTFVVNEISQHYCNANSSLYLTLLDASKAFDRVEYVKLFQSLVAKDICPVVCLFLIKLYTNQTIRVRWGHSTSNSFKTCNGVKQGGVLSPLMFSVYVDNLLARLRNLNIGCHIRDIFCGALGYADDIILLCPTLCSTQMMLKECESYARDYNVLFNASKSKLIAKYCNNFPFNDIRVEFAGDVIPFVDSDIHLGNLIGNVNQREIISRIVTDFQRRSNMLRHHFFNLPIDITYMLFKSYCMPLYGSQFFDLDSKYIQVFYTAWRKTIRYLLHLPYRTHCNLLPLICQDAPVNIQLINRFIKVIKTLYNSDNIIVTAACHLVRQGSGSAISNSVTHVSHILDVNRDVIPCVKPLSFTVPDELSCVATAIRDVHTMRCPSPSPRFFSPVECTSLLHDLCTN